MDKKAILTTNGQSCRPGECSMVVKKIFEQIRQHFDEVVNQSSPLGLMLWEELLKMHPADIAQLLASFDKISVRKVFFQLPRKQMMAVFSELSDSMKVYCLTFLSDQDRGHLLSSLSIDELTDFFDMLSDEELKKYLKVLHKKDREKILSLLQFNPESAGGIMDTNILTLMQEFSVEKSIQILQRLQPSRRLHERIFVTDQENDLVGFINIEDLVLKHPKARIASIMHENEFFVFADQDREEVAKMMTHYGLTIIPVVDRENSFLGAIPSDTLVEIIEEEASEDIYRMATMTPMRHSYFDTSFFSLLYRRSTILLLLLLVQSLSSYIMHHYHALLADFLMLFIPLLISVGGNTGSQSSALAIQGLATGDLDSTNIKRFMKSEFLMAACIAGILALFSFIRVYWWYGKLLESCVISLSLGVIVLVAVLLGSYMPVVLKRFNMDPAHSAGPLLATLMDIIGLLIFCFISKLILT